MNQGSHAPKRVTETTEPEARGDILTFFGVVPQFFYGIPQMLVQYKQNISPGTETYTRDFTL